MENYFDNMEDIDAKYLEEFNNKVHWFTHLERQPRFSMIDYKAKDKKGRKFNIELKTRMHDVNQFETIFIEVLKYNNLMHYQKYYNEKPLYINFFQNGDTCIIWSLSDIVQPDKTTVEIFNPGKNKKETVERFLLPIRQGMCYKKNNDIYERIW